MKTFSYAFGAGETKQYPSGKFFILITAGDDVNVTYKRNNGAVDESAVGVQSGYYVELDEGFDLVEVYSATAQTIKLAISKGGSGGFNISTTVLTGGNVDTLSSLDYIKPVSISDSRIASIGGSDSSLLTIVAPATNVNGVIVTSAELNTEGTTTLRLITDNVAPSAYNNGIGLCMQTNAGHAKLQYPVFLPAGYGLYFFSSGAVLHNKDINYTIL